jgi:hypothetical protein
MNQLWELIFCPQHGLLRVDNWPLLITSLQSIQFQALLIYSRIKTIILAYKEAL